MKWYEILVSDEFFDYFCDESNVFVIDVNGKQQRAPMFERYCYLVSGVVKGYAFSLFDVAVEPSYDVMDPDFRTGFVACKNLVRGKKRSVPDFYSSAREKLSEGVDLQDLTAEEIAALIIYPFCSRMGGSFEIDFWRSGNLKRHLIALKRKVEKHRLEN
ncbi:MAG: hypothetical protein IJ408_03390 [Clostridia bacterium]|nr:hypothetical protein [Clostridia bacterium]MBQ8793288.1 hypothetical protein [Clostridia bacterium]